VVRLPIEGFGVIQCLRTQLEDERIVEYIVPDSDDESSGDRIEEPVRVNTSGGCETLQARGEAGQAIDNCEHKSQPVRNLGGPAIPFC